MKRGCIITALSVFVLVGLGFVDTASAQVCSTVGAKVCQGGYIYVCDTCAGQKCLVLTNTRCHRDVTPDTFMGVQLDQPQARLCKNGISALNRALRGVQLRQPVQARAVALEVVALPMTVPVLN